MRDEWQIDCSDHGPGVQWLQHGRNLREFTLLVPVVPVGVNSPGSMQTKPKPPQKKQHVTHHSSQNLLDPRNPRGQTCDIWTVEGCHDTLEATTMSVSCAEPILFVWVWYLKCWESLKIHWLNYHHCHCPHWSLIDAHCGRKSMQITTFKHTHVNLKLYRFLSNTSGGFFKKT